MERFALAALGILIVGAGCGARAQASKPESKVPSLLQSQDSVGRVPTEPFVVGDGVQRVALTPSKG